jgi:hypothetical protein
MSNGNSNVQRLVAAGVITDANLTAADKTKINGVSLSDAEIDQLKSIQKKLGLVPLDPSKPGSPGIMQL